MQTPVDMTAYSSQRHASIEPTPAMAAAARHDHAARPPLEMPLARPKAVAVGQTGDIPLGQTDRRCLGNSTSISSSTCRPSSGVTKDRPRRQVTEGRRHRAAGLIQ